MNTEDEARDLWRSIGGTFYEASNQCVIDEDKLLKWLQGRMLLDDVLEYRGDHILHLEAKLAKLTTYIGKAAMALKDHEGDTTLVKDLITLGTHLMMDAVKRSPMPKHMGQQIMLGSSTPLPPLDN